MIQEEYDQFLEDSLKLTTTGGSDEALKKENIELKKTLKLKQQQEEMTIKNFASRELDLEDQIRQLKEQVEALKKGHVEEQTPIHQEVPLESENWESEVTPEDTYEERNWEPNPMVSRADLGQYSAEEIEVMMWIQAQSDDMTKQSMQWEQRILYSANLVYLKLGDATKDWYQPMLPYPLLKHEVSKCRKTLEFDCPPQQVGGYQPVTIEQ